MVLQPDFNPAAAIFVVLLLSSWLLLLFSFPTVHGSCFVFFIQIKSIQQLVCPFIHPSPLPPASGRGPKGCTGSVREGREPCWSQDASRGLPSGESIRAGVFLFREFSLGGRWPEAEWRTQRRPGLLAAVNFTATKTQQPSPGMALHSPGFKESDGGRLVIPPPPKPSPQGAGSGPLPLQEGHESCAQLQEATVSTFSGRAWRLTCPLLVNLFYFSVLTVVISLSAL